MAAGLATLREIDSDEFYDDLAEKTARLVGGLKLHADAAGIALTVESQGGMFGFVFSEDGPVRRFSQIAAADTDRFGRFFHAMLGNGVYLAPSAFEAGFVSAAHGEEEITHTLAMAESALRSL